LADTDSLERPIRAGRFGQGPGGGGGVKSLQWKGFLAGSIDVISKFWPTQEMKVQRKIILKLLAEEQATPPQEKQAASAGGLKGTRKPLMVPATTV
jgi:hypothetical protein